MYRYADPIAGRHEVHLRKATRSGVKPARAKEQVNEIAEATQQITKSGRSHLLYNDNNLAYNSWTTIGRAFIFHMCIPCDKTFPWVPNFWLVTLTLKFDLL